MFSKLILIASDLLFPFHNSYLTSASSDDLKYPIACRELNTDECKNKEVWEALQFAQLTFACFKSGVKYAQS